MTDRPLNIHSIDDVSEDLRALVDDYVVNGLDEAGMAALQGRLVADPMARRFFARYADLHRHLHLEADARRQGDAALAKIGVPSPRDGFLSPSRFFHRSAGHRIAGRWVAARWLTAAAVAGLAAAGGWWLSTVRNEANVRVAAPNPSQSQPAVITPVAAIHQDVAWLVNAQNCQWADQTAPADMKPGTVLKVERGLAELQFRSGAQVLLEGPAQLELVSDNSARLLLGRLTGRVTGPIKGFELLSPRGKVIDLGTEFGVSVSDGGDTDVYVFRGKVQAVGNDARVLDLTQAQSARLEGGGTAVRRDAQPAETEAFVRQIIPPPVIEPRTMRLNFGKGYQGTIADGKTLGTGLTYRLPGTGKALPENDANLVVNREDDQLELTTTDSDLNRQRGMETGEYLGARLADLGFTGTEDFEVQVFIPSIPALQNVGQFGLYAGGRSDCVIRGGLISRGPKGPYTIFMVNNKDGIDRDSHFVGLFATGDDLRLRLRRISGQYTLAVENATTGASSTLSIRHPAFLDAEKNMYVGLFGANTFSEVRRTLFIKEFTVTVWTKKQAQTAAVVQ